LSNEKTALFFYHEEQCSLCDINIKSKHFLREQHGTLAILHSCWKYYTGIWYLQEDIMVKSNSKS